MAHSTKSIHAMTSLLVQTIAKILEKLKKNISNEEVLKNFTSLLHVDIAHLTDVISEFSNALR